VTVKRPIQQLAEGAALLVAALLLGLACGDGVTDPDDATPVELSDREVLELLYASTS